MDRSRGRSCFRRCGRIAQAVRAETLGAAGGAGLNVVACVSVKPVHAVTDRMRRFFDAVLVVSYVASGVDPTVTQQAGDIGSEKEEHRVRFSPDVSRRWPRSASTWSTLGLLRPFPRVPGTAAGPCPRCRLKRSPVNRRGPWPRVGMQLVASGSHGSDRGALLPKLHLPTGNTRRKPEPPSVAAAGRSPNAGEAHRMVRSCMRLE